MRLAPIIRTDFRVTIHESDLDALAAFVTDYPHCETGGNLFGFWTHSGAPAIQLVLGPGPRARHETMAFYQDPAYMAAEGAQVQTAFGLQHIGDWHSHHTLGLTEPSGGDAHTIRRTLSTYGFPRFMALIATLQPGAVVEINAFLFEADSREMRRGSWVVLPGRSPVAEAARGHRSEDSRAADSGADFVAADSGAGTPARWRVDRASAPAPATPPAGWYTQHWGADFMRAFDAQSRQVFDKCRITAGAQSGDLYYAFEHDGAPGTIAFTSGFPREAPVIVLAGQHIQLDDYRPQLAQPDLAEALIRAVLNVPAPQTRPDAIDLAQEVSRELDLGATEEA